MHLLILKIEMNVLQSEVMNTQIQGLLPSDSEYSLSITETIITCTVL